MSETEFIRSLYRLAETCPQEDFQHKTLHKLKQLIQFDSAGWGESANVTDTLIILRACVYELPFEFLEDINKVQHLNPIVPQALEYPSVTINAYIEDEKLNVDKRFKKVIYKYDVPYNLFTTVNHDKDLFVYSTGIMRNANNQKFTETERQLNEKMTPHLIESYRLCRRFTMQKKLIKQWQMNRGVATCDINGVLHDADDLFVKLVKFDWPHWQGAQLPEGLIKTLDTNLPYKSHHAFYRTTVLSDLYILVATALDKLQVLSEREFQIAYSFSNGKTYKEIATHLSIAPATVRNHLASIYTKLELNSKDMLTKLF